MFKNIILSLYTVFCLLFYDVQAAGMRETFQKNCISDNYTTEWLTVADVRYWFQEAYSGKLGNNLESKVDLCIQNTINKYSDLSEFKHELITLFWVAQDSVAPFNIMITSKCINTIKELYGDVENFDIALSLINSQLNDKKYKNGFRDGCTLSLITAAINMLKSEDNSNAQSVLNQILEAKNTPELIKTYIR